MLAECVERTDVLIERPLTLDNRLQQAFTASASGLHFARARDDALLEIARALLEAHHVRRKRRRALEKSGVLRTRGGRAAAQFVHRLTRLDQAALRSGKLLVGASLFVLQPVE